MIAARHSLVRNPADRILGHVKTRPDAIAISTPTKCWTYATLFRHAAARADTLVTAQIGPESCVAIPGTREPETIASMLAVWWCGGVFVLLGSDWPSARLHAVLENVDAAAVLDPASAPQAPLKPTSLPLPGMRYVGRHQAAYIMFTSGTTGQPNAVLVEHGGLHNLLAWHIAEYSLGPSSRCSQLASFTFDASMWEIWPVLLAGGTLVLAPERARRDATRLAQWLSEERVTVAFVPTVLTERLLRLPAAYDLSLRFLLTGGEALRGYAPPALPFRTVNHYGPTECTVVATAGDVTIPPAENVLPPIGTAIPNVTTYVLDPNGDPCPTGCPGELYIGGVAVARGYINNPSLTAARFLRDRFAAHSGQRMYRTGDLVRVLDDGQLAYLGRVDRQLSIRGKRIEPAEVEAIILALDGVIDVVVELERSLSGTYDRLIATLVAEPDGTVTPTTLRDHVAKWLPQGSVPDEFRLVEDLDMTAHGKRVRRQSV